MKRLITTMTAAALLGGALFLPAILRAEGKKEKPAPEEREGRMAAKIKEKLGLSDEQAEKLKALRRAHRDAAESLRSELKASVRRLGDQLEDDASEKELSATLDKIKAGRKALREARDKFEADSSALLTPTQRAKLVVAMGRMMKHGGRGHGGGRGPGPRHEDGELED